jgi:cytochrome c556
MYASAVEYMPFTVREKANIKKILLGEAQIDPQMVEQLQAQIQQLQAAEAQTMLGLQQAETERIRASAAETLAKTQKTTAETQKVATEIQKVAAETRETEEDIEQKAIENDLMAFKKPEDINVTI